MYIHNRAVRIFFLGVLRQQYRMRQCEISVRSLPHVLTSDLGRTSSTPNQQRPLLEGFLREAEAFLPSPILYGIGEENKLGTVGDY